MAEEKKDNWTSWVALTTAILAVFAAVTTLYVGKYSSRTILSQAQETDQWSYYQAKSIKSYLYEVQKQNMELEILAGQGKMKADAADRYLKVVRDYDAKIKRYDQEKEEIKTKAEKLTREKEEAQHRAGNYGYGLIFLQIAIMLSSIAVLTKKKPLFYFGLASVSGWLFFFLDAIWLFY
jgi:hypothetical protein